MMMLDSVWSGGGSAAGRKVVVVLALLALVASVLVWAAPGSQAQGNQSPDADAGPDQTVAPGAGVTLAGSGFDADDGVSDENCGGCTYEWKIETGPYDHLIIGENASTREDAPDTSGAFFTVSNQAYIANRVSDDDPQKYEIVVRLTVTDNGGATGSDTVTININRPPVADIQVYAGLRDKDVADQDVSKRGHFPIDAVIDGPGENGNRDNEWDVMEGAYLVLDGSGSTDEGLTGTPGSYQWTLVRPPTAPAGYAGSQGGASATGQELEVAADVGDQSNRVVIDFGDLNDNDVADSDESLTVFTLPDVSPGAPRTVFYQLTVCDGRTGDPPGPVTNDITADEGCTNGLKDTELVRIVVRDVSDAPEVGISADLTAASRARGDAEPQETVGEFTGVENQFIVASGSAVRLTASVSVNGAAQTSGYSYRWSGASAGATSATATVRVPGDAADGDTVDVSVTVTDTARRTSVTTPVQLLVGENTPPTAGGVPANQGSIDNPTANNAPVLYVHRIGDGFQNQKDGSTVTLRGVGNDPDGDAIITAWVLREGPDHDALHAAITTWLGATEDLDLTMPQGLSAKAAADGAALPVVGAALLDMQEPEMPLFELNGALTDTVSFDVPQVKAGEDKGTLLLFSVIDSNGVADAQVIYIYIDGDDDAPNADAGADQQVDPGSFVRLNGSASSDPDTGDKITYQWEYTGATVDPAPNKRSPLSAAEIDELKGWILPQDFSRTTVATADYIVDGDGTLKDGTTGLTNLKSKATAYPYFDAPELTGFNNIKLTFKLTVTDSSDDDDDAAESDTDTVTITVVNRFYSGNVVGPDFCTARSLGGPQTYAFDSDGDGVAETCSLNTTRRATVARQNASETLANLNPAEFRAAVLAVCNGVGFKQTSYGDDPADLDDDVCETERVAPPPAAADPATAEVFFSGTVSGADFCTNFSLGGARTYPNDADGDGVADQCSLATTRREAVARQNALDDFSDVNPLTAAEQTRHDDIAELITLTEEPTPTDDQTKRTDELNKKYASYITQEFEVEGTGTAGELDLGDEVDKAQAEVNSLAARKADAARWSNALAAACRALGTQDFGDAPSALARDACAPAPATGQPLS